MLYNLRYPQFEHMLRRSWVRFFDDLLKEPQCAFKFKVFLEMIKLLETKKTTDVKNLLCYSHNRESKSIILESFRHILHRKVIRKRNLTECFISVPQNYL